jgi:hypothetical protein
MTTTSTTTRSVYIACPEDNRRDRTISAQGTLAVEADGTQWFIFPKAINEDDNSFYIAYGREFTSALSVNHHLTSRFGNLKRVTSIVKHLTT